MNECDTAPMSETFEMHEYGVIYLDILGQKELMKKIESGEASSEDKEKMQAVLRHIKRISKELLDVKKGFLPERADVIYSMHFAGDEGVRKNDIQEALTEMALGVRQFSDTTMIYVRLDGKNSVIVHRLFFIFLGVLESSLFQSLKEGIFIRGAVAKGKAWKIDQDNLYGPVINDAYILEEKVAQWSRIVVSNEVISLFKEVLLKCKKEVLLCSPFLQLAKTSFVKGLDGVCQLTFFAPAVL